MIPTMKTTVEWSTALASRVRLLRANAWPLLVAAALALQACGGGGGGGDSSPPPARVNAPSGLTYATPEPFNVGVEISPLVPSVSGEVTSFAVAPDLPAGLVLDTATGRISGTPTEPTPETAYTITASNAGGSTRFTLTLSVLFERSTTDRPDEVSGRQVHVLYVVPFDGTDRRFDRLGRIESSVRAWNEWLATQTGGKKLRLDTYGGGKLDVTFVQLLRTDAEMTASGSNARDKLEHHLLARGFDSPDKVYLVYYDGRGDGCGRGAWPPQLHGNVGAVYLLSPNCSNSQLARPGEAAGYWDLLAVHEMLHVLGFAPACAPNHLDNGHVRDGSNDLMAPMGAQRNTLDVNHDDYFGAAIADCPDFGDSEFLEPVPAGAVLPPGWPYANLASVGCPAMPVTQPGPELGDAIYPVTFVNGYGTGFPVQINELVLNTSTGVYNLVPRGQPIPYLDGTVVNASENARLVATVNGQCVAMVQVPAAIGRFVVRP